MILKTIREKEQARFEGIVRYVLTDDKERLREGGFVLTHNILGSSIPEITQELIENDNQRTKKRKNSVLLYHEILSFNPKDQEHLNQAKLRDIAEKYIEIRCPKALVLAVPHQEKDHVHIHFVISGSEFRSDTLLRMDNKQFERVKRSIETYQIETYPELKHSIVHLNKEKNRKLNRQERDKSVRKERAYQMKRKKEERGEKMDKERLGIAIKQMLDHSKTKAEFLAFIEGQDKLEYYMRADKLAGVVYYGRKYRFTTLGIEKKKLLELENRPLEKTKQKQTKKLEKGRKKTEFEKAQEKLIESYQLRFETLELSSDPKKEERKLKELVRDIMEESKSMSHFLYLLHQTGISPQVEQRKFVGVYYKKEIYNLEQMNLVTKAKAKQKEYTQRKEQQAKKKLVKENTQISQDIEIDLYSGGFGFF